MCLLLPHWEFAKNIITKLYTIKPKLSRISYFLKYIFIQRNSFTKSLWRIKCFEVIEIEFISFLNKNIIWGVPMIVLMLGTGILMTVITKGVIFRKFGIMLKYTVISLFKRRDKTKKGAISPFEAVCTALAATVGTGNIVGVALAIAVGGPGSIFWLWISAFIGMVLKYAEVTLAVAYRTKNENGEVVGGPMYYIESGLKSKLFAVLFCVFGFLAAFSSGAAVQANSLSVSLNNTFGIPTWSIGLTVALLSALILIGGINRISKVTQFLVPFMAFFYIGGAVIVLIKNHSQIPEAFLQIFNGAFSGTAAVGGFLGAGVMTSLRVGVSKGVFTHEGGMGSAPIAHACADTDHPARQGLWGAFEVFFDSIVMCTVSGLVILTSGIWKELSPAYSTVMSSLAFEKAFSGGRYIVEIGLPLFAFATIIAWYYYGEKCVEYLAHGNGKAISLYKLIYIAVVFLGCIMNVGLVWDLADLSNGLMAIPNLIALILLSSSVRKLNDDFFKDPHFIRKENTDFSELIKK